MPLDHFARRFEGAGRVTLTTLHSAKGRELDAVVMYGVNVSDLPHAERLTNEVDESALLAAFTERAPRVYRKQWWLACQSAL